MALFSNKMDSGGDIVSSFPRKWILEVKKALLMGISCAIFHSPYAICDFSDFHGSQVVFSP